MTQLAFESATHLVQKIKSGELTSVGLLEHYLARVDSYNSDLNAVIVQVRERAMARAKEADAALARGEDWGPLHGLPMTVKESYNLEGTPTTWGEPNWRDNIAAEDAVAIKRLEGAGAVVFGKTNVPLMLSDFQSYNAVYGTTNNPWDLGTTPGGSSGGSAAALAAGLTGLEIGSDIGGSIRNPAHFCGVFGHKPTWELLPMRGHAGPNILSPSDISVIGPLGRSAYDLQTAVEIMAGPDEIPSRGYALSLAKPEQKQLKDFKVAVWKDDPIAPVDREVIERVEKVAEIFAKAGATVDETARPEFTAEHVMNTYQNLLWANMAGRQSDEAYEGMQKVAAEIPKSDQGPGATMLRAQVATYRDFARHNEARTHIRWGYHRFFQQWDVLLTPMMATAAFPHDQGEMDGRRVTVNNEPQPYFLQLFWAGFTGVSYLPSTVVPTGPNSRGLPIGVQIVGPEYGDLTTLKAAQLLEDQGMVFQPAPNFVD